MAPKSKKNNIGAHVSAAGGVEKVAQRAHEIGCECYQFFTRSPQGGNVKPITKDMVLAFERENTKYGFTHTYVHAPYFINLASTNNKTYYGSISILREELERCSLLGVRGLMTHIGSAHDLSEKEAVERTAQAVTELLKDYKGRTRFLLEVSAGAGNIMGATLTQINTIITLSEKNVSKKSIGVCLDTAHLFASGYDIRTKKDVEKVAKEIRTSFGWDRVEVIHSNDSKVDLGERKDRHEHIGKGKIGKEGFEALITHKEFGKVDFILETPEEELRKQDIRILKGMRDRVTK